MCVCIVTWLNNAHTHAHATDASCGHMFASCGICLHHAAVSRHISWPCHDMYTWPHHTCACGFTSCSCVRTRLAAMSGHVVWPCHNAYTWPHDTCSCGFTSCGHVRHIMQPCQDALCSHVRTHCAAMSRHIVRLSHDAVTWLHNVP